MLKGVVVVHVVAEEHETWLLEVITEVAGCLAAGSPLGLWGDDDETWRVMVTEGGWMPPPPPLEPLDAVDELLLLLWPR